MTTDRKDIMQNNNGMKCVIVIDEDLPVGLLTNTAAVLSLSLGKKISNIIGDDMIDGSNNHHSGITTTPIPILKNNRQKLSQLRSECYENEDIFVVDFSDAAQTTKNYADYQEKLSRCRAEDLNYLGLALYGPKRTINKLTGSLPLLR